jgi:hypothetical protein
LTATVLSERNHEARASVMVQEDFERLHKFLLETDGLSEVSDDMRQLVEHEWPELVDVEDYILQMAAAGPSAAG